MIHRFIVIMLVLGSGAWLSAEDIYRSYLVKPGKLDLGVLTATAQVGDTVTVRFSPDECYEITSGDVDDIGKLGWTKIGNYVFRVTIPAKTKPSTTHEVRFHGTLRKTCGDSGGSDEELTWERTGRIKLLPACEGIGCDNERKPPAALTAVKPGSPAADGAKAQFDPQTDTISPSGAEYGEYLGAVVPAKRFTPKELSRKSGDCPANSTVKVTYVYQGVDPSTGEGVKADPDTITIETKPDGMDTLPGIRPQLLQEKWDSIVTGTTVHEKGHRDICYAWVDKAVAHLNTVRAYGYSTNAKKAEQLSLQAFAECVYQELVRLSDEHESEQEAYDAATNHGQNQGNWPPKPPKP